MSGKYFFEVKVILKRFFLRRDKILGVVLKAFGRTDLDFFGSLWKEKHLSYNRRLRY